MEVIRMSRPGSPTLRLLLATTVLALTGCAAAETKEVSTESGLYNLPGEPPYLMAHFLPWFEVAPADAPDQPHWQHWKWDGPGNRHDPNTILPNGQRDLATAYYPLIGPYSSHDRDVFRYHLETAKSAGISIFLVLWYGPNTVDSDVHLPMMLDEAEAAGMRIAICYEEKVNWPPYRQPESRQDIVDSFESDLRYILEQYGDHPAYLRREGKPFVAQFNYWGQDEFGPRYLQAHEFQAVFDHLPTSIYYCRQNLDRLEMHPTIRSAYMWIKPDPAWIKDYTFFAGRAESLYASGSLDFFMGFVSPGFDDSGVSGWGGGQPRILARNGLDLLQQTMAMSTIGQPELIQIVTWNDWQEGTAVEPSREQGFEYLDAIEEWWGRISGRPVDLQDNRDPFEELKERNVSEGLGLEME